ncbi:hypothetical protein J4418_01025 [Candidatus Woesearchaeota archaeon]|nr:hypothetical protein [Candidatus Woesearchaeota archaeon]
MTVKRKKAVKLKTLKMKSVKSKKQNIKHKNKISIKSAKSIKFARKTVKSPKKTIRKTENVSFAKEEIFYMGISNPIEIRRNILESARDMVQFLQMFEKFRIIREEKKQATLILKKQIKDLNIITNKLKARLPKASMRYKTEKEKTPEPAIIENKKVEITKETPIRSEMPDIDINDIEALETELKDIEDKLHFL